MMNSMTTSGKVACAFSAGILFDAYLLYFAVALTGAGHGSAAPGGVAGAPDGLFFIIRPIVFILVACKPRFLKLTAALSVLIQFGVAFVEVGGFVGLLDAYSRLRNDFIEYLVIYSTCNLIVLGYAGLGLYQLNQRTSHSSRGN